MLPHSAHLRYNDDVSYGGTRVAQSALQPGDLVFYEGADGTLTEPGHVGVYRPGSKPSPGGAIGRRPINGSHPPGSAPWIRFPRKAPVLRALAAQRPGSQAIAPRASHPVPMATSSSTHPHPANPLLAAEEGISGTRHCA